MKYNLIFLLGISASLCSNTQCCEGPARSRALAKKYATGPSKSVTPEEENVQLKEENKRLKEQFETISKEIAERAEQHKRENQALGKEISEMKEALYALQQKDQVNDSWDNLPPSWNENQTKKTGKKK